MFLGISVILETLGVNRSVGVACYCDRQTLAVLVEFVRLSSGHPNWAHATVLLKFFSFVQEVYLYSFLRSISKTNRLRFQFKKAVS
jgi:hypothetical protein